MLIAICIVYLCIEIVEPNRFNYNIWIECKKKWCFHFCCLSSPRCCQNDHFVHNDLCIYSHKSKPVQSTTGFIGKKYIQNNYLLTSCISDWKIIYFTLRANINNKKWWISILRAFDTMKKKSIKEFHILAVAVHHSIDIVVRRKKSNSSFILTIDTYYILMHCNWNSIHLLFRKFLWMKFQKLYLLWMQRNSWRSDSVAILLKYTKNQQKIKYWNKSKGSWSWCMIVG